MATKLIELRDGTLVEAEVDVAEARPISGGAAEKVASALDTIEPVLVNVCRPIADVWSRIGETVHVESIQVELGLGFEGEGNIFVTKAKASANLTITLTIARKDQAVPE
jgi:Trypsin-co-occurring domain 1